MKTGGVGVKGRVALIGNGYLGSCYEKFFDNPYIYDEPKGIGTREEVNQCYLAMIAVPTNGMKDGSLDTSIIKDIVGWLETPLILIKSALMPGTIDWLKKKYPQKRICVSVEMLGEGNYFIPFWKYPSPTDPKSHNFLIIGGEKQDADACAGVLWNKMSPDINIHLVSAIEAEITKLMENTWGALKVTFANTIYDICKEYGASYINVLQAWGADGRTEKMHMRVTEGKRGWRSKCYDKDIPALAKTGRMTGVNVELIEALIDANKEHLKKNG